MDYKEKYEQGLECLEEILNSGQEKIKMTLLKERLLPFFPELESEDERMKKKCINFLNLHKRYRASSTEIDECIAWLEKQGKKKVPSVDFKAKDYYVSKVDGNIHDMTYNPADKLEAKFHKDDWIVNNITKDAFLIKSINSEYCTLEDIKGNIISPCLPFESEFHLWTIQDAKDGDVLIDKSHVGECVFIFKEARPSDIKTDVNNPLAIIGYCGINHIGFTSQLSGLGFGDTVNCTYYPATKEQRDLLFQKMKEAGYELDVEKKAIIPISKSKVVEYVYILDYCSGRVIVTKHDVEEPISELFEQLGLKENQCHYMTSSDILSIEYINF